MKSEQEIREYLCGKDKISIPMLQYELKINYPEAKRIVEELTKEWLISKKADGIFYAINKKSLYPRTLLENELNMLSRILDARDLDYLNALASGRFFSYEEVQRFICVYELLMEKFEKLHLVHKFDDAHFISIDCWSLQNLRQRNEEIELVDIATMYISYPILEKAIAKNNLPNELFELHLFPTQCATYIKRRFKECSDVDELPSAVRGPNMDVERTLMSELIFSFASKTVVNFITEAHSRLSRELDIIDASPFCTKEIKKAAHDAADYIVEKLEKGEYALLHRMSKRIATFDVFD